MTTFIISPVGIFPIDVKLREGFSKKTEITEHAVERGASIADHAHVKPFELTLETATGSPHLAWQALKRVIDSKMPCTIVSGLDVHTNMLVKDASVQRDKDNDTILAASLTLREVRISESASFSVDAQPGAGSGAATSGGESGGVGSSAVSPSKSPNGDPAQSRAGSTVHRGDTPTSDAPTTGNSAQAERHRSILSRVLM